MSVGITASACGRAASDSASIADAVTAANAGVPLRSSSGRLKRLPKSATLLDRLTSGSTPAPNGCRNWVGSKGYRGYGRILVEGKAVFAHRLAYIIAFGPVPDAHHVCHKCDNPCCIAPEHLFAGTNSENMADMVSKGRQASKLTQAQVLEIRNLISTGISQREVAANFGVTQSAVSLIKMGANWAHLPFHAGASA